MASRRDVIVGLDVGTRKVMAAAAEVTRSGAVRIVAAAQVPSWGMKKGQVVDLDAVTGAIAAAVDRIDRIAGTRTHGVVAALGGPHLACLPARGEVLVADPDRGVTPDDVARVTDAVRSVALPSDREVLHAVVRGYALDGTGGIRDPVGMSGERLEVDALLVTAAVPAVQNLLRAVARAGLEVEELVLAPLGAAEAVVTRDERDLGVAVVDVGAGTLSVLVLDAEGPVRCAVAPVGSDHITADLAIGLRAPVAQAEQAKCHHGWARAASASDLESVDLTPVGSAARHQASERTLAGIIEPRVAEMLDLVREELHGVPEDRKPQAGAVLTGGGARLRGLVEAAAGAWSLPVRLGAPSGTRGVDVAARPEAAVACGVARLAAHALAGQLAEPGRALVPEFFGRVRDWLREVL